jgi:hypothetical protein
VDSGCPPGKPTCDDQESATSYAAPRLARKLADLKAKYPAATVRQIRLAVLATAKVPFLNSWRPVAVRSGGMADIDAADRLLANLSSWPTDNNIVSPQWQQLLMTAKAGQFSNGTTFKKYVLRQSQMLVENFGEDL